MKKPSIGELKHRIGICTWAVKPDDTFGSDPDYGDPLFVWASITPVSGAMYLGSMQVSDTITHRFIIRTGPEVTMAHVLEANGMRYRVKRCALLATAEHFTVIEAEEIGKIEG